MHYDWMTSVLQDFSDSLSALLFKLLTCKVASDLNFTNYGKSLSQKCDQDTYLTSSHNITFE
jgi:hypothetical protein